MLELITASENLPFTVSLLIVGAMALLEGVMVLMGLGISEMVEGLLPNLDADIELDVDADLDVGADVDGGAADGVPALSQLLGWLRFGQVPAVMLMLVFFALFGLAGLVLQGIFHDLTGAYLSAGIATLPALALALPGLHFVGGALAALLPKDETEAVSSDSFLGLEATVILGTARSGSPAQAKLVDEFRRTHYVMVEPQSVQESFETGTSVTLTERTGAVYRATVD